MNMIPVLIIFIIANIVLAFIDSRRIRNGKSISHVINAAVYVVAIVISTVLYRNYWMVGAILFMRLTVFNIALSLFRGLKWDYISPMPAAVTDRIARAIFKSNGKLMYYVYSGILIIFIIKSVLT